MGTPIELIAYDSQTGKFKVGAAATKALRACRGPVAVVAVCGRARQGKSFILNQLLQQTSGGFVVGPTHRPCTKGLWMWSSPQARQSADGLPYHLVMLDTEGIDAYDQTTQYSTQIFSLAVLLSSLFVYNQMGGIDEAALDRLSLVTAMTKRIRSRADGSGDTSEAPGFSPSFLWLLRDFYLTLEEDGRKITPKDYLETALMPVSGSAAAVQAKNQIRESIKSLFPDRQCFALVRPVHEERALVNLDHTPTSALRPEFREGVQQLTRMIFSKALPKRVGSQVVTGPVLSGLLHAYVDAINGGAVPTIATAWQGVAEAECRRAVDAAEAQYCSAFNQQVAPEELDMEREHQRAVASARVVFQEVAVGEGEVRTAHERRLQEAVENRYVQFKARRLAEASAAVNELLLRASADLNAVLAASDADVTKILARLNSAVQLYKQQAAGPTKWMRLAEFLASALPSVLQQLVRREADARQQEVAALKASLGEAQQKAAQAEAVAKEAAMRQLQGGQQAASLKAALEDKTYQVSALEAQLRDLCAMSEKKVQSAESVADARLAACKADAEAAEQQLRAKLAASEVATAKLQTQADTLGSRCHTLQSSVDTLQHELQQLQQRCSASISDKSDLAVRVQQLEAEAAGEKARRQAAEAQLQQEGARASALASELEALKAGAAAREMREDALLLEARSARRLAASRSMRGSGSPGVGDRAAVEDQGLGGGAADTEDAGLGASVDIRQLEAMTIVQIKQLLLDHQQEEAAWKLATQKPAPRKSAWVATASNLLGGGGV